MVIRMIHSIHIPLRDVHAIVWPASHPEGSSIGILRVQGIYGTFGSYWNRHWGRFHAYITDHIKRIEIRLVDCSRVIVSPDDSFGFVEAARRAAEKSGTPLALEGV